MNSQIGMQDSNKDPARIPPPIKLLHARYARITRIEPLQTISNVLIL